MVASLRMPAGAASTSGSYRTLDGSSTIGGVHHLSPASGNFQCRFGVQTAQTAQTGFEPDTRVDTGARSAPSALP